MQSVMLVIAIEDHVVTRVLVAQILDRLIHQKEVCDLAFMTRVFSVDLPSPSEEGSEKAQHLFGKIRHIVEDNSTANHAVEN